MVSALSIHSVKFREHHSVPGTEEVTENKTDTVPVFLTPSGWEEASSKYDLNVQIVACVLRHRDSPQLASLSLAQLSFREFPTGDQQGLSQKRSACVPSPLNPSAPPLWLQEKTPAPWWG